jgi:hypothetical protein
MSMTMSEPGSFSSATDIGRAPDWCHENSPASQKGTPG